MHISTDEPVREPAVAKIFVGTLYVGESEFDACCAAISHQKGVEVEHFIIRDLPELEAHNALWKAWNERRQQYDFFVKIDADTVLKGRHKLRKIVELMSVSDEITGAQIPLHDYFTDDSILGMNVFSKAVYFVPGDDGLFADRGSERGHNLVLRNAAVASVSPAGFHCNDPSPKQAFHFGFHRMLKGQLEIMRKTGIAWSTKGGDGRYWALLGAWSALRQANVQPDYNNPLFLDLFNKVSNLKNRDEIARFFLSELEDILRPKWFARCRYAFSRRYWRYYGLRR